MLSAMRSASALRTASLLRSNVRGFTSPAPLGNDIIGIDLGTTNSCVAIMEVSKEPAGRVGKASGLSCLQARALNTARPYVATCQL